MGSDKFHRVGARSREKRKSSRKMPRAICESEKSTEDTLNTWCYENWLRSRIYSNNEKLNF